MTQYIAFLRAINVGGRTVKMERLRELFVDLGFSGVATFIASGNVIFVSPETDASALERRIEEQLQTGLGYAVDTFLRSTAELAAIASYEPFPGEEGDTTLYGSFLHAPPDEDARRRIAALATPTNRFHLHDRELYWLVTGKLSDSVIDGGKLERALDAPMTMRNAHTIQRLVAKYPPSAGSSEQP